MRYSQPDAAKTTSRITGRTASLRSIGRPQVARGGEQRPRGVAAPKRPVVAAADEVEAMREMLPRKRVCKGSVLRPEPVVGAAVEPHERVRPPQCGGDAVER